MSETAESIPQADSRQYLAEKFFTLRDRKDTINAELKDINSQLDDIEKELVVVMENENLQNFKDDRFGTLYLREEVYARVESEDKFFPWLRDRGMADVIKYTVHAKTLSGIVKELNEKGESVPEGVVAQFITKLGYRKAKGGAAE